MRYILTTNDNDNLFFWYLDDMHPTTFFKHYEVLVWFLLTVKYDIAKLCNVSKENSKFYYGKKIDAFWCLHCMALTKIDAKNLLACTNKSSNTNMTLVSC